MRQRTTDRPAEARSPRHAQQRAHPHRRRRPGGAGGGASAALAADRPARYDRFWRRRLRPVQQTAFTNRWLFERLGDRGYAAVLGRYPPGRDVREWLHRAYRPRLGRRLWYALVARRRFPPLPAA